MRVVHVAAACAVALGSGCARNTPAEDWFGRTTPIESLDWDTLAEVGVRQGGGVAYWVLPGERVLGMREFGTPASPYRTAELPFHASEVYRDLVGQVPWLVGVPRTEREKSADGLRYTVTAFETPFGDEAIPVRGSFRYFARDRRFDDADGDPFETPDEASATVRFTDPDGARYEVELSHVVEAPIPGWDTDGGVLLGGYIGGDSGADSPLAPRAWAWAAIWGLADVRVNGRLVDRDKLVRIATTEVVRDRDYRLAQSWELPLAKDRTVSGRAHHTSVIVYPVRLTPVGPVYEPLNAAYPADDPQPFVHVTFENDRIVHGPPFAHPAEAMATR